MPWEGPRNTCRPNGASSPKEIDAVHGATYCVVNNVVEVRDRRAGGRRGGA